jgi:hypothetical protein
MTGLLAVGAENMAHVMRPGGIVEHTADARVSLDTVLLKIEWLG